MILRGTEVSTEDTGVILRGIVVATEDTGVRDTERH